MLDGLDLKILLPKKYGSTSYYIEYLDNPLLFIFVYSVLIGIFSVLLYQSIMLVKSSFDLEVQLRKHKRNKIKRKKSKSV